MAWLTSAADGTLRATVVGATGAAGAAVVAGAVAVGAAVGLVVVAVRGLVVGVVAAAFAVAAVVGVAGAVVAVVAAGVAWAAPVGVSPGWRVEVAGSAAIWDEAATVVGSPPGRGTAPALTATPRARVTPAIPASTLRLRVVSVGISHPSPVLMSQMSTGQGCS
jgi:hypothetical protein